MRRGTFFIISPISRCMVFFTSSATITRPILQAEEMEGIESKIMRTMNMPDPYPARDPDDVGDA